MLTRTLYTSSLLLALQFAAAAPAPQVAGYTNADASFTVEQPTGPLATSFGPDSQVPVRLHVNTSPLIKYTDCSQAIATSAPPAPPRVSSNVTGFTSHGPYSGTPTTIGAV